jgi:hypothetical protein
MRSIPRLLITCGLLLSTSFAANAETATELPGYDLVLSKCVEVSENPEIADPKHGRCITETRSYLGSLLGKQPELVDAKLTDLVVALAELPRAGGRTDCNEFDDEIAQAIIITSESSSDRLQRERFVEVADTITGICGDRDVATSALSLSGAPTSNE